MTEQYRNQWPWRDWQTALSLCPIEPGQHILDLGCGTGDIAKELVGRGVRVTGVDLNEELLSAARQVCPEADFQQQDLGDLRFNQKFDGIWSSMSAAYLPNFADVLEDWIDCLKPAGWICLIEAADLLSHSPRLPDDKAKIEEFYRQSSLQRLYNFKLAERLPDLLEERDFSVLTVFLQDRELGFHGPAPAEILTAWKARLDRMQGLQAHFGPDFAAFRSRFLSTLQSADHQSHCRVVCSVGVRS